jgi:glycosyltransferase involved in cell wall biosynthesis
MRLALVHDGIFCRGGAERVLLNMHKAFPLAPIYTSIFDQNNSYPEFKECDIRTSWLQSIIKQEKAYKATFPFLGVHAMQSHDLSNYDVILASTTNSAKYIKPGSKNLVINYCYTPFRLVWNPNSYKRYQKAKGLHKYLFDKVITQLKKIDFKYAQRANNYIAMTAETAERIRNNYQIKDKIEIINPSIDTSRYYIAENTEDYYLIVSRLEKYKKVDLAINAFNKLGKPLKIVGRGMESERLKKEANNNIEFLGGVSEEKLIELYSKCKALIFPQHEDYGLTPLEANACGRPVIAYGKGGIETTMVPYNQSKQDNAFTAVFFPEQNIDSLINAIKTCETLNIDMNYIRKNAEKFDDSKFIYQIREYINKEYKRFMKN